MNHSYANKPIPILKPMILPTVMRTSIPVDMRDSRAREQLVDIRQFGVSGDNFYARDDGSNAPYCERIEGAIDGLLVRTSVATMIAKVDSRLRSMGLRLFVLDGYRPITTQRGLWSFFWNHFARAEPGLTDAEIESKTLTFVSDPRRFDRGDSRTWPLHSTGGAVDLTLCTEAGDQLDLGTTFDDPTEVAATAFFEERLLTGEIVQDDPRLLNRRTLYWAMREEGFTNYVYEWWHFDWGNQMHVVMLELLNEPLASRSAWYGYTEPLHA